MVNIMVAADVLATQGARASATMTFTKLNRETRPRTLRVKLVTPNQKYVNLINVFRIDVLIHTDSISVY